VALVRREDLGQAVHEGAAVLRFPPSLDLSLQDLRAALHQPAQEREVLELGAALVAPIAHVVQ
jgi:hypothetical protein